MHRDRRLIIGFRQTDLFTGCHPKPIEYGKVDDIESVIVNASPGFSCKICEAAERCKMNYTKVDVVLPSQVSSYSDS